ncbi:DUF6735 family protein [Natrononativus amylolyticus]|uniref:DUF6735 family protein n=1 Tax=Natrononativus amylolyticus TaxID=2963434 RepID=UPI0020CBF308|nr:DUF6735 family protein [Natrononativus amylolyticus]
MGHRALVAYRRPDGRYDLRYSHWGADRFALAWRLTASTPLASGAVEPDLMADGVSPGALLAEHLDPRTYEALYLVSGGFDVTTYLVASLELHTAIDDARRRPRGVIVEVTPGTPERELRNWLRVTTDVLADVVDAGALSRETARAYLENRVRDELNGYCYTYEPPGRRDDERRR